MFNKKNSVACAVSARNVKEQKSKLNDSEGGESSGLMAVPND